MEIIGWLVVTVITLGASLVTGMVFLIGGFELGNIFTSKDKASLMVWLIMLVVTSLLWRLVLLTSPFTIAIS